MKKKYDFHALANILPLADGPELDALADDIKAVGLNDPIIIHEDKILDGRRRYLACRKAGVTPKFLGLGDDMSPLDYVVSANIHRRHLNSSQLALVGLYLLPHYEAQAKERQRLSKGRGKKGAIIAATFRGKASNHVGKIVGCSGGMIEKAKRVQKYAPELLPKIESSELTISKACESLNVKSSTPTKSTAQQSRKPALRIAAVPKGFTPQVTLHHGDAVEQLRKLPSDSVNVCVTSVPYYMLRDYEQEGQIGLEPNIEEWVSRLVAVFREVRRVLRPDGTTWINVNDAYANTTTAPALYGRRKNWTKKVAEARKEARTSRPVHPKSLLFSSHRLAIGLAEDGWIGRSEIIVEKNGTDGCKNRPVRTHEYVYLFTKRDRYYYDYEFLREDYSPYTKQGRYRSTRENGTSRKLGTSIWRLNTVSATGAGGHPAPMPLELAERCVIAGCTDGGTVLDPFFGSGTTAVACVENRRHCIGIDISAKYLRIAQKRVPGAKVVRRKAG